MIPSAVGVCYAVFVVNQWNTGEPAKLEVDFGGVPLPVGPVRQDPDGHGRGTSVRPFDPAVGIPQNEVAILFLSRDSNDAMDPTITDPSHLASCPPGIVPAIQVTELGDPRHRLRHGVPYSIERPGRRLPDDAVRRRKRTHHRGDAPPPDERVGDELPRRQRVCVALGARAHRRRGWVGGVAPDGRSRESWPKHGHPRRDRQRTQVTINPVTDIVAGPGVPPSPAGVPITYTVDQGQFIQFTQEQELTGSAIESNHPIALIAGSTIMDVPVSANHQRADHGEQMIPPVQALGSQYVGVKIPVPRTDRGKVGPLAPRRRRERNDPHLRTTPQPRRAHEHQRPPAHRVQRDRAPSW